MAEARINPLEFGGYDDEFVDKVEDSLTCTICCLPLKEAVQTKPCGHRFCKSCIDCYFARQEKDGQPISCPCPCPTRLNREQDIFNDNYADRMIRSYTIKCPNRSRSCQWRGKLSAKEDHLASCPNEIVSNFQMCTAHLNVCPKVPITCPLKCGMTILREKVADHMENQCELIEISCPYSKLGCREKFQRKEKTSHLQSCMQVHLDLACVKLTDTDKELRTTRERMSALENRAQLYYNVYTWKIGGFEEILRQAKTGDKDCIESDPFYTGECGYKFKMRLFPNGNGDGENTHLSLFLINMEGEYDAILQWPCAKDISLTLIDQKGNLDDRETISSALGRVWTSRPLKGKEVVWGFQTFVAHDGLQKRAYIVDDTIFFQAKFE